MRPIALLVLAACLLGDGGCGRSQPAEALTSQPLVFRDIANPTEPGSGSSLSAQEATGASQFVESFLACSGVEDRLAKVLDPEPARRSMSGRWATQPSRKPLRLSDGVVRPYQGRNGKVVKRLVVVAELRAAIGNAGSWTYVLAKTNKGYKVNATETWGLSDMSFLEFVEKRPDRPVLFRVEATLANYYNFEFGAYSWGRFGPSVREQFYSIQLENPDAGIVGWSTYGYLEKSHPSAKALFELLKDGQKHQITVMLATYPWLKKSPNTICVVDSFVAPSWVTEG
jgi:hypothetical protein